MSISIGDCGEDKMADVLEDIAAVLRCPVGSASLELLSHKLRDRDRATYNEAHDIAHAMVVIADVYIPFVSKEQVRKARTFAEKHGRLPRGSTVWDTV